MASKRQWGIAVFVLRLLTVSALVVTIAVITTDDVDLVDDVELHFNDVHVYRYVLSVAVIGCAYGLFQLVFAAYFVSAEKHLIRDDAARSLLYFADVVIALLLATGVGAGFAFTVEEKMDLHGFDDEIDKFLDLALVSTAFLLLATICMGLLVLMIRK